VADGAVLVRGDVRVRRATEADAAAIAAIWNHEVTVGTTTTDTEPRDLDAQRAWLAAHGEAHPVLVAEESGTVIGYGCLSPYRPKPAFRHTVENSVYVDRRHRGRGVGDALLARLLAAAAEHGHRSVLARITAGNERSVRLHERHGFRTIGVEREVACKLGRWLDVIVMQRMVDPPA
jgi:L-amino acid N-acyltransferase YncA